MRSADYWRKRSEQAAKRQYDKSDRYEASLKREYSWAIRSIERDLRIFYQRFADANDVTLAEAKRLLNSDELAEFKMTLKEFTAKAKSNADGTWTKELDNVYFRTRVSRLDALLVQVQQQVELLAGSLQAGTGALLADIYEDTYYRSIYEIQTGVGYVTAFAKVDSAAVEAAIARPWYESNYSARIWENRRKLVRELRTLLVQGIIRGDSVESMTRTLSQRMEVARSNAERIIRSESAHIVQEATYDGYKASGIVQKYRIVATLDSRTSNTCQKMDGKVFLLSEKEVSVTYPPFHANCRTTTVAEFEDSQPVTRIARDAAGKNIKVPGNMTYETWKKEYGPLAGSKRKADSKSKAKSKQAKEPKTKQQEMDFAEYDITD